jgi:DNA primase
MKIPIEFYELLRNRINLSDIVRQKVNLTKRANEYLGLCPFHNERTPSFTVNDFKKFYYCFGCSESGDVIKFISKTHGLSYQDSAIKIAKDYGIELPKLSKEQRIIHEECEQISSILQLAVKYFRSQLHFSASQYLETRGIDSHITQEFNIGFAPSKHKLQQFFQEKGIAEIMLIKAGLLGKKDGGTIYEIFYNRIMFPIYNVYNEVIGFGGRIIGDGSPKYLNSPETFIFKKNETLYGENKAIKTAYSQKYYILVEGYLDVIALHKAGFTQAVASLGTAVTELHLQKLWRVAEEIVICLDGDVAGIKASTRVINLALPLITNNKKISFIMLPNNSDPDSIIAQKGRGAFEDLLKARIELSQMIWRIEYDGRNFTTPEARAALEINLENYCTQVNDNILRNHYRRFFKDQIWQNLIRKKSHTKDLPQEELPQYNLSELETIEYAFCSMFVRFPQILLDEDIKSFLLTLPLTDASLSDFRDWYFEAAINDNNYTIDGIDEITKNTRFNDTFLLLLGYENRFQRILNLSLNNKEIDLFLLFEILRKQYHLVSLKHETALNGWSEKTILYQQEMLRISEELENLKQSFYNN